VENRLNGKEITAILATAAELVAIVPIAMTLTAGSLLAQIVALVIISAIVMLCAAIVAVLLQALIQIFRDEIFPTETTSLSLAADGSVDGGTLQPFTRRFSRGSAVYDATFQWNA
jgi:hypothetical protein